MATATLPELKKNPDGTQTSQSGVTYSASGGAVIPTLPTSPIDASAMSGGTTPLTLPPAPTPYTPPVPSATDIFGVGAARRTTDDTLATLKGLYEKQGQQGARQQELEQQQGIPEINADLEELYAKDAQYQADLDNINSGTLQSQLRSEDRLAPTFAIRGEQAQAQRQAAFLQQNVNIQRSTNLAAIAQKQGKLALAQDYVARALDAEFKPLESEIDYFKQVLSMNADRLSKTETAQLNQVIADKQFARDEAVKNKEGVLNVMLQAIQGGASNSIVAQLQRATTPEEALSLAAPYLGSGDNQVVNLGNGMAQLINTRTGKVVATYNPSALSATGVPWGMVAGALSPSNGQALINSARALRYNSVAEANRIIGDVTSAVQRGDVEAAEDVLRQFGYQKLSGTNQEGYNEYDNARAALSFVATQLENSNISAGPYKALAESAKPWLSIQRDKEYTELMAIIEQGQAQLRKRYFGTAVTDTEAGNSFRFLITDNDAIETIRWKAQQGAAFLQFVNDATIARAVGLPHPELSSYLVPQAQPLDDDGLRAEYERLNGGGPAPIPKGPMSVDSDAARATAPAQAPAYKPPSFDFSNLLGVFDMFTK
jgi:hypothetical protein